MIRISEMNRRVGLCVVTILSAYVTQAPAISFPSASLRDLYQNSREVLLLEQTGESYADRTDPELLRAQFIVLHLWKSSKRFRVGKTVEVCFSSTGKTGYQFDGSSRGQKIVAFMDSGNGCLWPKHGFASTIRLMRADVSKAFTDAVQGEPDQQDTEVLLEKITRLGSRLR